VFIPGFTGHLEVRWEDPDLSRLYRRLAAASRLVLLDKRGTGMSDRTEGYPPLPQHVDDVLAVMDAVGCRRAALFGVMDGGAIALLTAVAHPDRVVGVATYATTAVLSAQHHPPGVTREARATLQDDRAIDPGNARFLADRIPHARLALLAGEDTVLWAGDVDAIAAEIEAWLPTLVGRVG
jgi:pimeloyl-ACP methyl ester carboxylesterase